MVMFLGFGSEVKAAQGLTCLYEKGTNNYKYMLVQDTDGNLVVWRNDNDVKAEDVGWVKHFEGDNVQWGNDDGTKGENVITPGSLTKCPGGVVRTSEGRTIFYEEYEKLDGNVVDKITEFFGFNKMNPLDSNNSKNEAVVLEDFSSEILSEVDNSEIYIENGTKECSSIEQSWFDDFAKKGLDNGSTASCVYYKNYDNGCHIIRMGITTDKKFTFSQHEPYKALEKNNTAKVGVLEKDIDVAIYDSTITNYGGVCPSSIFVDRQVNNEGGFTTVVSKVYLTDDTRTTKKYIRKAQTGNNLKDGSELTNDVEINIGFEKIEVTSCEDLFGESGELIDLLKFIINLFRILVPIMLIGLGTLDFAKAIFAGSEDNMKKAQGKFIKRVLIAVAIFLVPSLLKLILDIANGIWGNIDASLCGLL